MRVGEPFEGESVASFVWRYAASQELTLGAFCVSVLRLSHHQRRGDLDVLLSTAKAEECSAVMGVAVADLVRLACPLSVLRQPRVPRRSPFGLKRVWACPECLGGSDRHACRNWQSVAGVVCASHGRYLVGACSECGEVLNCNNPAQGGHWLDCWPWCPVCGAEYERGPRAPLGLLRIARRWQSENLDPQTPTAVDEALILSRLANRMQTDLADVAFGVRRLLDLPPDCDAAGVAALCAFEGYSRGLYEGRGAESSDLLNCLLGLPLRRSSLAELLVGCLT